jgi:sulfide dehydrogenase cytochrome subunit
MHAKTEGAFTMRSIPLALAVFAVAGVAAAQSADPNLARNIAANCANCHGTNGVSQGVVPSLAGQSKADLVRKMQDFKSGKAAGTIMPQLAKGYTDEQIDLAAGFFAAQK